uniref:Putative ovule protein n=1 Tax=Solanum chacoense TaxID=4108 RepID=A0A0V0HVU9_SOLCH
MINVSTFMTHIEQQAMMQLSRLEIVNDEEHVIGEYIKGYRMHAAIPWHMVDHVFVPVHVKNKFHWVLAVISLNDKRINVYDSYRAAGHDAAIKTRDS